MGYAISSNLFAMAMEIIVKYVWECRVEEWRVQQTRWIHIHTFIDYLTLLYPLTEESKHIHEKLEKVMQWDRMKFKPKQLRSWVN